MRFVNTRKKIIRDENTSRKRGSDDDEFIDQKRRARKTFEREKWGREGKDKTERERHDTTDQDLRLRPPTRLKTTWRTTAHIPRPTRRTYEGRSDIEVGPRSTMPRRTGAT